MPKMSELDKWFGPPAHQPEPVEPLNMSTDARMLRTIQGGTRWHCEDSIKPALDAFIQVMGENYIPRSPQGRSSIYASARALVGEVGETESASFVRWACAHMNHKALAIKDLRSLLFLAPRWRATLKEPSIFSPCPRCFTFHPPGQCPEDEEIPLAGKE